jgi:putative oxidoreductase
MDAIQRRREDLLSLFRFVVGLLYCCHGLDSLFGLFGSKPVAFGVWPGFWAALIETVGGAAIALGVGTRIAAVICSGEMAFAYFYAHQKRALWPIDNGGELPAVYSWVFLLIAVLGPGSITVARLWQRRRQPAESVAG